MVGGAGDGLDPTVRDGGEGERALAVLVAASDSAQRAEVRRVLAALEEPRLLVLESDGARTDEGGPGAPQGVEADVAMVVVGANKEAAVARLQEQDRHTPRPAVFALLGEPSEPLVRRVLNAGADEVLPFPPSEPQAWMRALLKVNEVRRAGRRKGRAATFSLTSVMGGVGLSTLSANLGLALLHTTGARVALIDLDLQQGGLGALLGVKGERTMLPLASAGDKLDPGALEAALTRHPTGLYLLAAPGRIEESEQITDTTVEAVLEAMSQRFDYVVVDCGRHIDGNTAAALERSSEVLYVLRQGVHAVRCALRFLDLCGRLQIGREPRLVLNKYNPRHPISEAQISATVRRPIYARVPRDDHLMKRAAALEQPPCQFAPHSALVRAYEELAERLAAGQRPQAAHYAARAPGFMSRLLTALGARA